MYMNWVNPALRFTRVTKKELLWNVHSILGSKTKPVNEPELFCIEAKKYELPELTDTRLEHAYHVMEHLGFPITLTMFDLLDTDEAVRCDPSQSHLVINIYLSCQNQSLMN